MEKKKVTIERGEAIRLVWELSKCGGDAERSAMADDYILRLYKNRKKAQEEVKTAYSCIYCQVVDEDGNEDGNITLQYHEVIVYDKSLAGEGWTVKQYTEPSKATANTNEIAYIKARLVSELRNAISELVRLWAVMDEKQHTTKELPGEMKGVALWKQFRRTEALFDTMEIDYKALNDWLDAYKEEAPPIPSESPLKYKGSEEECLKHYAKLRHLSLITCKEDEWLTLCGLREGEIKPMAWGIPGRKEKDNMKDFVILLAGFFGSDLFSRTNGWQNYLIKAFGLAAKESAIKSAKSRLKWEQKEKERLKYMIG